MNPAGLCSSLYNAAVNYDVKHFFMEEGAPTANVLEPRGSVPLSQARLLQEPAVAVASGRPPPVPRDVGEAWAAPGLFLPRGPQPHLHLASRPPNRPDPSFPRPPREPPVPELGFHRVREWGEACKCETEGISLVLMLTLKIALCFSSGPTSQSLANISL